MWDELAHDKLGSQGPIDTLIHQYSVKEPALVKQVHPIIFLTCYNIEQLRDPSEI